MLTLTDTSAVYNGDTFVLTVIRTDQTDPHIPGKPAWAYTVEIDQNGGLQGIASGTDLYGWGKPVEMLASLACFLSADAEKYARILGPVTDPYEDGYLFGETVAEWAYSVADELSLIEIELEEE